MTNEDLTPLPKIRVFTTRPDTLFGATYMVLSPEHPLLNEIVTPDQRQAVEEYRQSALKKTEMERTELGKEKTGVFTGAFAINPVNHEKIPVWVADYVLYHYGTGAIMAVPAHDQRDFAFAKKYKLVMRQVVWPVAGKYFPLDRAYEEEGYGHNSGEFCGLPTAEFKVKITEWLENKGLGCAKKVYKLRDWVFSRQRYWGEPIPVVHCQGKCGKTVLVPEEELPLKLPEVKQFQPTGTGDSPLCAIREWVETKCPVCGGAAERETNTMPQWAGSCWYYLRFIDPNNSKVPWDKEMEKRWGPVDLYVGGSEHAVLHLLYARFWHKVLYDLGWVSTKEPFLKLRHQGMILSYSYQDKLGAYHGYDEIDFGTEQPKLKTTGEVLAKNIEKMSKSKKNVVNPDEIIGRWGADTVRLYEMFMGEFEFSKPWDMTQIEGVSRFLQKVWRLIQDKAQNIHEGAESFTPRRHTGESRYPNSAPTKVGVQNKGLDSGLRRNDETKNFSPLHVHERLRHKTIKLVTERIETFRFNTAISALMEYVNNLIGAGAAREDLETLLKLLSPFAPHLAEECWEILGNRPFVSTSPWPKYDENLAREEKISVPVQINGKLRDTLELDRDSLDEKKLIEQAKSSPKVSKFLENAKIVKVIYVPGKILNFVVKESSNEK
ncbi:MAG: leucine--tRNA ligase [Elusimicrobia bacterium]|nr:leucine--tRNA ligase [Elusimicrobiota bacterium]